MMGGAVGRYTRNDPLVAVWRGCLMTPNLAPRGSPMWARHLPSPSAGAWTILPWPQIMYAPSQDWFVSLGASYSGNSWAVNNATGAVGFELGNGFDFGFGGGMRIKGPLRLEATAGVGGLRALTITDGDVSGPSIDVSSSPFVNLSLTFRPSFAD